MNYIGLGGLGGMNGPSNFKTKGARGTGRLTPLKCIVCGVKVVAYLSKVEEETRVLAGLRQVGEEYHHTQSQ